MDEAQRLKLWSEAGNYMFGCFQWASSFDDGHGHFNVLALQAPKSNGLETRILSSQRKENPVYAQFCKEMGVRGDGSNLLDWPALPINYFNQSSCFVGDPARATRTFKWNENLSKETSPNSPFSQMCQRVRDISLPIRALLFESSDYINHGASGIPCPCKVFSLLPDESEDPTSSLVFAASNLTKFTGSPGSTSFGKVRDSGTSNFDVTAVIQAIDECCETGEVVHIIGTTKNYEHLLEQLRDKSFTAPINSSCMIINSHAQNILDSGIRDELSAKLGVKQNRLYGALSLNGFLTRFYEISGINSPDDRRQRQGLFIMPPWVRCVIYDENKNVPLSFTEAKAGKFGRIAIFDPVNIDSISFILTNERGRLVELDDKLRQCLPAHPRFALEFS